MKTFAAYSIQVDGLFQKYHFESKQIDEIIIQSAKID